MTRILMAVAALYDLPICSSGVDDIIDEDDEDEAVE